MRQTLAAASVVFCAAAGAVWAQEDQAALVEEAKGMMQAFGGALKAELTAAVEAGGPVNGIEVCNTRAPAIAAQVPGDSGWIVSRSSHKLRNPLNGPDDFTAAAIAEFLERQSNGEAADTLVKAAMVEENGQKMFRLVKAIPTGELCLNCHGGDNVKPEVVAKLAELYPADQARGFSVGEMRGVFTLIKPLN